MSKDYKKSKIILIATIAFLFSGIHSFADMGKGYGQQRGMHQGQGRHHRGSGDPGCGATDNLSADEIKQLDESRTAFFEAAEVLRRKIYQKRLELASELAKENPDAATAVALQKDVSDFKAQIDQKRLEHRLRIQKINPDLAMGFGGGGHMGPGMMHRGGYGMDAGCGRVPGMGHHGGYGMGAGCGKGPGMMHRSGCGMSAGYGGGPGMKHRSGCGMGSGYGKGSGMTGPGGPGRNCPQQYNKGQSSQTE